MVLLRLRLPWEFLKDRGKETFAFQLQSFLFAAGETEAEREQWSFLNLSITWSPVWSPGKGLGGRQDRCSGSRCPKCPPHSALKPQGEEEWDGGVRETSHSKIFSPLFRKHLRSWQWEEKPQMDRLTEETLGEG